MVHPKRLNKIKLEDVIAIITLSLFFEIKLLIYCIGFKKKILENFNIVETHLFEGFKQKSSLSL